MISRFEIEGDSMEPSLKKGSRILVSKWPTYKKGDIVVFEKGGRNFIKRIVGRPGECINFGSNSQKLSKNQYYVLGDNLCDSLDSRKLGPIEKSNIKGKMLFSY